MLSRQILREHFDEVSAQLADRGTEPATLEEWRRLDAERRVLLVEVEGLKTFMRSGGKGDPVVMIHGLGATSYSFRFLLPALEKRHAVYAVDMPGFGRTDKPWDHDYSPGGQHSWLLKLLDHLGLEKVHLIGNSMGGLISLFTAMDSSFSLRGSLTTSRNVGALAEPPTSNKTRNAAKRISGSSDWTFFWRT